MVERLPGLTLWDTGTMEAPPMLGHKYMDDNGLDAILATKRSAVVAPMVNLRVHTSHICLCQLWERLPPLAFKPRGDIARILWTLHCLLWHSPSGESLSSRILLNKQQVNESNHWVSNVRVSYEIQKNSVPQWAIEPQSPVRSMVPGICDSLIDAKYRSWDNFFHISRRFSAFYQSSKHEIAMCS